MVTRWFSQQLELSAAAGPTASTSDFLHSIEGPCTILRTQVWVFSEARKLLSDITVPNVLPAPQGWSFRESRSNINPDDPPDIGTWGEHNHYLAAGVIELVPRAFYLPSTDDGVFTGAGLDGLTYHTVYSGDTIVVASGKDFVDSHAQRVFAEGQFPLMWLCSAGNGIISDGWDGVFYELQCWFRVLVESPS